MEEEGFDGVRSAADQSASDHVESSSTLPMPLNTSHGKRTFAKHDTTCLTTDRTTLTTSQPLHRLSHSITTFSRSPPKHRELTTSTEEMDIPTSKDLSEIYPEDYLERQTKRWNSLISTFKDTYGKLPDFVSRSPGRVNLIGEVRCSRDRCRGEILNVELRADVGIAH